MKHAAKTRALRWVVAAAFALSALSACSEDPSDPRNGGDLQALPTLPIPEVRATIVLAGAGESAREARALVRGQFQRIGLEFGRMAGMMRSYQTMRYAPTAPGEWAADTTGGYPDCRSQILVEQHDDLLDWSWLWWGTCESTGQVSAFKISEMATSLDAQQGALDELWALGGPKHWRLEWTVESSNDQWRLFTRETTPPALLVHLDVREATAGGVYDMTRTDDYRWHAEVRDSGASGDFELYRWDAAASEWDLAEVVHWAGDGGSWTTHPVFGASIERSW